MGCTPVKPAVSPPIIPGIKMEEASRNVKKIARSISFAKCEYCGVERMGEGKCRNCGAYVESSVEPTHTPSDGTSRVQQSAMDKFLANAFWAFVIWAIGAFLVYILS